MFTSIVIGWKAISIGITESVGVTAAAEPIAAATVGAETVVPKWERCSDWNIGCVPSTETVPVGGTSYYTSLLTKSVKLQMSFSI